MKNILVPTDNSACAKCACDAAYLLAKRFGAKLHFLTSIDLPPYWEKLPAEEKENWASINEAIAESDRALQTLKASYPGVEVLVETSAKSLPKSIGNYIENHGIDLLVMGSHGTSGKSEFFIGSNTQKVVRTIHAPTLIVKHPLKSIDFQKIVFASSFQETEMESFLFFKNFVKHFVPEIHLVAIHKSVFDPPYPLQLEAMKPFEQACSPLSCVTHVFKDLSVDAGIRSLSEEIGAQLIAISYHDRHPIKRMLAGSNVEALINHADLPVLTIDYT